MRSQMMQMPTGTIDVAARWFTPLTATNVEDDTIQTNDKDTTLNMLLSLLVLIELSHQILNVYCIIMTEQEMALAPSYLFIKQTHLVEAQASKNGKTSGMHL